MDIVIIIPSAPVLIAGLDGQLSVQQMLRAIIRIITFSPICKGRFDGFPTG
jgi:hypothetical protein